MTNTQINSYKTCKVYKSYLSYACIINQSNKEIMTIANQISTRVSRVSIDVDPSREKFCVHWDSDRAWHVELDALNVLRLLDAHVSKHEPEHISYGIASFKPGSAPYRERLHITQHRVALKHPCAEYTTQKNVWEEATWAISLPGAREALVQAVLADDEANKAIHTYELPIF